MKKIILLFLLVVSSQWVLSQSVCTPDFLWGLGRVSGHSLSEDGKTLYYAVTYTDIQSETTRKEYYSVPLFGGQSKKIVDLPRTQKVEASDNPIDVVTSPNGLQAIVVRSVKIEKVKGSDLYSNLPNSNVLIYDQLNYRHWDTWEDGEYDHVFVAQVIDGQAVAEKDIMANQAYDCPTKPFGGSEDYIFTPDSKQIVYVCKKKKGSAYAISTNSDIYLYDIQSGRTSNLTGDNLGYDMNPSFSKDGNYMAYTQMKRDGYESDKNDIVLVDWKAKKSKNITAYWDESISSFTWSDDNETIFFIAAYHGTMQLFKLNINESQSITQVTNGEFDIRGIVAQSGNYLVVNRGDMNHATELFSVNTANGQMKQLTHVNDAAYASIKLPTVKARYTDIGRRNKLFSWVIYPPNFDPSKKYPTLLYCQGGPQSALSQFYSTRWNFQLMASQGYIVIAPNRTGMPGWGTKYNEDISGNWGGQPMDDYLAAIDDIAMEPYVDANRLGAVGASYGGYSVFMLAGIHEGRFKTFISHCGLFDLPSWYGTTEELFFANWDIGGPYWDTKNKVAQHSYENYSPSNYVNNWNTPILIIQGGRDYRVPIGQGLAAFQAAQLKGIKSRLMFLPDENHWVLSPQNALVWQQEFFRWLKETL